MIKAFPFITYRMSDMHGNSAAHIRLLATSALIVGAVAAGGASTTAYHAVLKKSWPAAHDTLAKAPDSLKLWFSERVELPLTKIALASAGSPRKLTAPALLGDAANAPVVLAVKEALGPGVYTVNWIVAGKDGHPSKGSYEFVVKAGK